jgi:hypothetical protein
MFGLPVISFVIGCIMSGYYYWIWGFQTHPGSKPRLKYNITWLYPYLYMKHGWLYIYNFHIHHWLLGLVIQSGITVFWWCGYELHVISSWLLGWVCMAVHHGLSYSDWWQTRS